MGLSNDAMSNRRSQAFSRRGQPITYKKFVAKTINHETGATGATYTDTSITNALVWDLTHISIVASEGRYRIGDKSCRILVDDLPASEQFPSTNSKIVISGTTYAIVDTIQTGDGNAVTVILRA